MKTLTNHRGLTLQDDAADSLARFEAKHGAIPVTSALRTVASQQALIDRWDRGGDANRPPFLYAPARPATAGKHTKGIALDTTGNGITLMHRYGPDFGWFFNYAYDKVHFEYDITRDKSRLAPEHNRPVLRVGSHGARVRDLQSILIKYHGAKIVADGQYGAKTVKAVKAFQKKARLTQDGVTGDKTWAALGQ